MQRGCLYIIILISLSSPLSLWTESSGVVGKFGQVTSPPPGLAALDNWGCSPSASAPVLCHLQVSKTITIMAALMSEFLTLTKSRSTDWTVVDHCRNKGPMTVSTVLFQLQLQPVLCSCCSLFTVKWNWTLLRTFFKAKTFHFFYLLSVQ